MNGRYGKPYCLERRTSSTSARAAARLVMSAATTISPRARRAWPLPSVCRLQGNPLNRDPVHQPALAVVIVERIVPGRPIVPERDRAFLPFEPRLEFRPCGVLVQVIQKRPALLFGPTFEVRGEVAVDIKRRTSGLGMANDDRMHGILRRQLRVDEAIPSFRV